MAAVANSIERILPLLVKATAVVCCVGLSYQASKVTWAVIEPAQVTLPTATQQPSSAASNNASFSQAARNVADFHLLGLANIEPEAVPQNVAAPETRLSFELKGILAGGETGSSAIIAKRGGAGEYFVVGDMVFNQARLSGIKADHVLLNNRGKIEKLAFEEANARLIQKGTKKPTPAKKPSKSSGNRFEDRLKTISTPEEFVDLARAELIEDPNQALDQLGVESAGEGYRVTNKAGMLLGLGMQAGDVILSINGQPLGDIEQDRGLIDQVYAAGQARIEVQRGNRRFIINHSFR